MHSIRLSRSRYIAFTLKEFYTPEAKQEPKPTGSLYDRKSVAGLGSLIRELAIDFDDEELETLEVTRQLSLGGPEIPDWSFLCRQRPSFGEEWLFQETLASGSVARS